MSDAGHWTRVERDGQVYVQLALDGVETPVYGPMPLSEAGGLVYVLNARERALRASARSITVTLAPPALTAPHALARSIRTALESGEAQSVQLTPLRVKVAQS